MKFLYTENPLCTVIELDDHDREILALKIKIEHREDLMISACVHLEEGDFFDLDQARKDVDPDYLDSEVVETRLKDELVWCEQALKGSHAGDCTCFPASCLRCHAENLLGISTITGLGKHSARKIYAAFESEPERTLDEVILSLETSAPVKGESWAHASQEEFDRHVPSWSKEAKEAAQWLRRYQAEHFQTVAE